MVSPASQKCDTWVCHLQTCVLYKLLYMKTLFRWIWWNNVNTVRLTWLMFCFVHCLALFVAVRHFDQGCVIYPVTEKLSPLNRWLFSLCQFMSGLSPKQYWLPSCVKPAVQQLIPCGVGERTLSHSHLSVLIVLLYHTFTVITLICWSEVSALALFWWFARIQLFYIFINLFTWVSLWESKQCLSNIYFYNIL